MCEANSPSILPRITVGEIFRARYESRGVPAGMSKQQCKAFFDLMQCRTPLLGGYQQLCQACGHERNRFNSCGNRHCPTCQSLAQARWIETRLERILPVGHFHVVFTLPDSLRDIAYSESSMTFCSAQYPKRCWNCVKTSITWAQYLGSRWCCTPGQGSLDTIRTCIAR